MNYQKMNLGFDNQINYKKLAIDFIKAETEKEIDSILNKHEIFADDNNWRNYGDLDNNFGTIGNQQSDSTLALVEKIINSIDAVLISEAKKNGIDPNSDAAPKTMNQAVEKFFNIQDGEISLLSSKEQTKLAEKINLIATGSRQNPSYIIYDKGEGQRPEDFPDTLLSLHKSNKDKILFVQGRFNMGGTGALPFCGQKNYQFVMSRKHPKIDDSNNEWGFTLVRRRRPKAGEKSLVYEYFAPDQKIVSFKADNLDILPDSKSGKYKNKINYGTLIKLYEYDITDRTLITFDLYYSLNRILFNMPIPVRLVDARNYKGDLTETTLTGMTARIANNPDIYNLIEKDFPISEDLKIKGLGTVHVKIWLFKDGKEEHFLKASEAIILTINGQAHATYDRRFFTRKRVKKDWIKNSLLVHLDCSDFSKDVREDLFMGSRDRLRTGDKLSKKLEKELENLLKNDVLLKKWNIKRKEEKMKKTLEKKAEETKDLFQELVKKNSEIAILFGQGKKLANPWKIGDNEDQYEGKRFPTYFELINPKDGKKNCPENSYCRVVFETDVENEFLDRANDPGELRISNDSLIKSRRLRNGKLTLTVVPELISLKEGDRITIDVELDSFGAAPTFVDSFILNITETDKGKKKKTKTNKPKDKNDNLNLPNISLLEKEDWPEKWSEDSTILIKESDKDLDIYINRDNVNLKRTLKTKKLDQSEIELYEERFKIALGLIGFSIYSQLEDEQDKEKVIQKTTKPISQIILPLIEELGDLSDLM